VTPDGIERERGWENGPPATPELAMAGGEFSPAYRQAGQIGSESRLG